MTRRIVVALRLLLGAGLLAVPASSFAPGQRMAGGPEPVSAQKISISAVIPALTPARPEPGGQWLSGRRDQQRTYTTRAWALIAAGAPLAILLAFGVLGVVRGWRARFRIAARPISSRAPPAPGFA